MEQLVTVITAFIVTIFFSFAMFMGILVAAKTVESDKLGEYFFAWVFTTLVFSVPGFIFLGLMAAL